MTIRQSCGCQIIHVNRLSGYQRIASFFRTEVLTTLILPPPSVFLSSSLKMPECREAVLHNRNSGTDFLPDIRGFHPPPGTLFPGTAPAHHYKARITEAALFGSLIGNECAKFFCLLLESFQRRHAVTVRPRRQHGTGKHWFFIQKYGTESAVCRLAARLTL